MRILRLALLALLGAPALAKGQVGTTRPFEPAPPPDRSGSLSVAIENDVLNRTDRYYTNGLQLSWYSPTADLPRPLAWIDRQLDALLGPGELRWGAALGHALFTPRDTERRLPDPTDRPYVGFLYGTVSLARDAGDSFTIFEMQAGIVGPAALGEQVQNNYHRLIRTTRSEGWQYQIHDEFVAGAVLSRIWRAPLLQIGAVQMEALPTATLSLGTIQSLASAGGVLRIGQGLEADYGPARIRPALSGSAFFQPRSEAFGWYVFLGAEARAVARDITLDGNTWRESRHVTHRPIVGDAQFGLAILWKGVRLSYSQVLRSEEFFGQRGGIQRFGSMNVTFRF